MIFSSKALQPSSTSICEYPVRRSIIVSHAGSPDPLCQIFHFRASFRPHLLFAKQICKDGWTPSGLPSVLNCAPIHTDNTGKNSFMEPAAKTAAAFVHFLVRGEPALGVGGRGRKRKQPKDPAPPPAHDPAPAIVPPASGGKEVRPFPSCPDLFYPPLVVSLLLPFARRRQTDLRAISRVPARTCPPFRMVPEPLRSHTRPTRGFRPPTRARPS